MRGGAAEFSGKKFADISAGEVHSREDDVVWRFFAQLDDEFAEVGFDDFKAGVLQCFVEMNLLGGHGLGLDDGAGPFVANDSEDNLACLLAGAGPVHLGAAGFQFVGEGGEILVEMVDGIPFGLGSGLAGGLPVLKSSFGFVARGFVFAEGSLDKLAMTEVVSELMGARFELLRESFHDCASTSAKWMVFNLLPWRSRSP